MTTILIIDDEEQMRGMLRKMLERAGYDVLEAMEGEAGLNLYKSAQVDLVITDLLMPGREGLETIMAFKRENPAVRIIAISGGGRDGVLNFLPAAEKLGAAASLSKPFERQELLATIARVLGPEA